MPKVKRRSKHARRALGTAHIMQLKYGWDFLHGAWGDGSRNAPYVLGSEAETLADMQNAWQGLRDKLLQSWIAKKPGSRPWAFWRFDAAEERDKTLHEPEQLAALGELIAAERRARILADKRALQIGLPQPLTRPWGWWITDSPQPRNYAIDEAEQLAEMGELTETEQLLHGAAAG